MAKEAVFTMKLEPDLRDAFMAAAAAAHRPASQILRELMREFVERKDEAQAYRDYVRRAVELGREDVAAGRMIPNEQVKAEFAALRAELAKRL